MSTETDYKIATPALREIQELWGTYVLVSNSANEKLKELEEEMINEMIAQVQEYIKSNQHIRSTRNY